MPKLSEAALDERRNHILRAAEVCFARDGFHSTTIADIRKEAGVSTGAIYTYFSNKEAMMSAILERAREDRRGQLEATGTAGAPVDPAVVLLRWVGEIFNAQGRHAARVDVNLWAEALRNRRVRRLAQGALGDATSAVAAVVAARLPASGPARSLDPEAVASVLVALFLGLEVQTAVGMRLDPSEVVRVLAAFFADYVPAGTRPGQPAKGSKRRARSTRA